MDPESANNVCNSSSSPLSVPLLFDSISAKEDENKAGGSSVALKVVIELLRVVAAARFGVFMFRIWQKKKREEQHARLKSP
ncbi:hypothetical protein RchiOBHm_Chr7g0230041 [Rosa chinensis]|uniref:Uncharacterized protein n=1 Tax=Rosa chinensis TaxID=74649 RepID=A0A2P6PFB8_ROSCH|nr:hypothetical protein RchiOBHm_Chr7g0230041 [Rosa chinensis]